MFYPKIQLLKSECHFLHLRNLVLFFVPLLADVHEGLYSPGQDKWENLDGAGGVVVVRFSLGGEGRKPNIFGQTMVKLGWGLNVKRNFFCVCKGTRNKCLKNID